MNSSSTVVCKDLPEYLTLTVAPNERLKMCWESLIGIDPIKQQLLDDVVFHLHPDLLKQWYKRQYQRTLYAPFLLKQSRGTSLLLGCSGTGKTTLANGLADQVSRRLKIKVNLVELGLFRSKLQGVTGYNIVRAFDVVKQLALQRPSIFLLDELESVAPIRSFDQMHEEIRFSVTALIRELDKISSLDRTYIIGLSNLIANIDIAVMRRFELIFTFRRPTFKERTHLFENLLRPFRYQIYAIDEQDIYMLSRRTEGYTHADITKLVTLGVRKAASIDKPLTTWHLTNAMQWIQSTRDY